MVCYGTALLCCKVVPQPYNPLMTVPVVHGTVFCYSCGQGINKFQLNRNYSISMLRRLFTKKILARRFPRECVRTWSHMIIHVYIE